MKAYLILFLFLIKTNGLKTWIPRTGINSTVNWDAQDVPKTCDNLFFPLDSDVAVYWNVMVGFFFF